MKFLSTLDLFHQIFLSFLVLIFSTFAGPAAASQPIKFILAWDANSEEDLGGYEIYFRTLYSDYEFLDDVHVDELEDPYNPMVTITDLYSGELPDSSIPVVNMPALAMVEGATYYFSLTAFDVQGNTSDFSDELCLEVTGSSVAVCKSSDSSDDRGGAVEDVLSRQQNNDPAIKEKLKSYGLPSFACHMAATINFPSYTAKRRTERPPY